ncbi:hypothetical protein [Parasedimentitalea psychrophila]|uniref:Uncharacterized protein n=1 Tax=Parasedimentitalea psychrophila TaxID=2997337 RepID=A0A9Y2P5C5_9RHOB|nr:hypothetical protein [Parasedimentitalea psychrophila]WIY26219.1 hypothetical protein QPJ95_04650 [Parasedimentitalea psychrophila]
MQKVTRLPNRQAQDALKHLEQAWAYYTPEPVAAQAAAQAEYDLTESPIVPYYSAA